MNFNRILLITSFFFIGCQATKQIENSTCTLYKKGNFVQYEYNDSGMGHWRKMSFLITRTDTTEIIISKMTILPDDTSYYHIRWSTPCSYEQTYISSTNKWVDSLVKEKSLPEKRTYFITKAKEKYYIQKQDNKKDTIWIR